MQSKFLAIFLVSVSFVASAAVIVGSLVLTEAECTTAGLASKFLGLGSISGTTFFPDPTEGISVYECIAKKTVVKETVAKETVAKETVAKETVASEELVIKTIQQIIRYHNAITFEHVLFAAPELWGMDTEYSLNNGNKISASSDNSSKLSFWGVTNLTQISEEQDDHLDTDIYQFTGGFDKSIGDVFFGSALAYAHTEDESSKSTSDTVGFTPYVAYKINDYLFASALAGYLYTHTNAVDGGNDLDTHDYVTEGNLNAFKVINSFILKGRVGVRYKHTISSAENGATAGRDNSFDELTWVGDGEIGYKATEKLRVFTGLLYEYYEREANSASIRIRDSIAFMRYGIDYPLTNELTLGAKIQHDINDEDRDYITGSLNARLAF